tara:strand:+ start:57 stop:707 length:651 start_codon:yes stop_codon:yes gene_type:complete
MINELNEKGFIVIRNFFVEDVVELSHNYLRFKYNKIQRFEKLRELARTTISRNDPGDGYSFYTDDYTESLLLNSQKKLEKFLRVSLFPTYSFCRIYERGNSLVPHIDRNACEISVTCPAILSDNRPSTIFVSNKLYSDSQALQNGIEGHGNFTKVDLLPGDIMIYKGIERLHWRDPLESDYLIQFFMHYVLADGQYTEEKFNRRPYIGYFEKENVG